MMGQAVPNYLQALAQRSEGKQIVNRAVVVAVVAALVVSPTT